ncbi:hypothetical protein ACFFTM_14725 [Pseudoduganella plicata]|nr:hypothetical protein [Pseudoduganella plicata]QBQ34839.1 hypothetical protein E1742_00535 [Pseudoduganella plicata]
MPPNHQTILWLTSEQTGKTFPVAQFSADTDLVTMGWVSLTSVERPDIVVTAMTASELANAMTDTAGYLQLEARINKLLHRTDLVSCWLVAVEEPVYDVDIATLSFQQFRKIEKAPRLMYRDIYSPHTCATVSRQVSRRQFERQGGTIRVV